MARILSRRADGAPAPLPGSPEASAADQPTGVVPASEAPEEVVPAEVAHAEGAEPASAEQAATPGEEPTAVHAPAEGPAATRAPAGPAREGENEGEHAAAADAPAGRPSFRDRGRMRRRLRYLRRVREIGFRDLGGLVFDLHRFGRERPDLVEVKLEGLRSIDSELRALEVALDDVRPVEELEEPGIAACLHCGALHGSEARFCPACGTAVGRAPFAAVELPAAAPETPADDPPDPADPADADDADAEQPRP